MNEKNLEYLQEQIKYTGFGNDLAAELKEKIMKNSETFTLNHQAAYGNDQTKAELYFSKSMQSDMYFFNAYKVTLQKDNAPQMEQTFYINKGNNITLKEAYNLMNGRAINKNLMNKEGDIYNTWIQMDFKQTHENGNHKLKHYHENYGYDLEGSLAKHPIKELENPDYKENIMDSIKKGNRQSVTFTINGEDHKRYVEANPKFKAINIYNGNKVRLEAKQKEKLSNSQSKSTKKENKLDANSKDLGDDNSSNTKKIRRRKAKSI